MLEFGTEVAKKMDHYFHDCCRFGSTSRFLKFHISFKMSTKFDGNDKERF